MLIATGKLAPGEQLPSVRELARLAEVNANTPLSATRDEMIELLRDARRGAERKGRREARARERRT